MNKKTILLIVAALIIFFGLFFIWALLMPQTLSPKEARQALIDKSFDPWDGSHMGLVAYVKGVMNDPRSFEHIETRYRVGVEEDFMLVQMSFRGKNAFGGVIRNFVIAEVDFHGNVKEILSWGP